MQIHKFYQFDFIRFNTMWPILIAAGLSSIASGAITYFFAKTPSSSSTGHTNATAEIRNDVKIDVGEIGIKHDFGNTLLMILVCLRIFELIIYIFNSYKKTLKKKYNKSPATLRSDISSTNQDTA